MTDCTDDCDLANLCNQRHWSIYWLIIVGSFIFVVGRILTVGGPAESPFKSANDRSRWATIRALGDHNRYEIDDIISDRSTHVAWDSIDKVQHVGKDGEPHFYSSKPTLLPTILGYLYGGLRLATGLKITDQTTTVARIMLLIANAIPWLIFLWLLGKTLECVQIRDWSRYFIVAAAGFGTFLSTFATTLNNHLPAAVSIAAALYCLVRIVNYNWKSWLLFTVCGIAAAFAAANELPALSFLCVAGLVCFVKSPTSFLLGFIPGAAFVAVAFFGTNYLAHDDWKPPYAHKSDGAEIAKIQGASIREKLEQDSVPTELESALQKFDLVAPKVERANWPFENDTELNRWKIEDRDGTKFTVLNRNNSDDFTIHQWDNWYAYDSSYWIGQQKSNVDRGQNDTAIYAFHVLFGHHGIFSLTPIWLLSLGGMFSLLYLKQLKLRWLSAISILLTAVVLAFYIFYVPGHDRNYGGHTSAFRWAFWLAPFWLICMAPIVDWLGRTPRGRAVCFGILIISAVSALYSADNPWCHPWLYEIWDSTGLPK